MCYGTALKSLAIPLLVKVLFITAMQTTKQVHWTFFGLNLKSKVFSLVTRALGFVQLHLIIIIFQELLLAQPDKLTF